MAQEELKSDVPHTEPKATAVRRPLSPPPIPLRSPNLPPNDTLTHPPGAQKSIHSPLHARKPPPPLPPLITHWDAVMSTGTKEQQLEFMVFGLQNVTHSVDAASALQLAPWSWQGLAPATICC
ncbi:hypothetical protein B0H11DRAFT_2244096 [Mycena galericulata]|nr:hypothetical protein B0H11DRAFT_2244096 [Mycena galericulata]